LTIEEYQLNFSATIGLAKASPFVCSLIPQLPELRLNRGILHGNNCLATQIKGQFPVVHHRLATYRILHGNNGSATLGCKSMLPNEVVSSIEKLIVVPAAKPDLVDAETLVDEEVCEEWCVM
jgi:hypothetical protein